MKPCEIGLYRGKRLDNGEWVEGHFYTQVYGLGTIDEEWYWFIKPIGSEPWVQYRVDPTTVGAFIGTEDVSGTRIFVGDVVVSTNERRLSNKPYVVGFDPLNGYWMCQPKREPMVVGNIHDNPKLRALCKDGVEG